MTTKPKIAIVGGGPGGLMLARLLLLRGLEPIVFERDRHADDRPQGGSLDLHAETGQRAMRLAGLEQEFRAAARPEDQGDRLYDQNGVLLFDRDGAGDNRPEIDRTALRQILLNSLPSATVRWTSKVDVVTPHKEGGCDVVAGGASERFDIVVGADGAWSRVRPLLSDAKPLYEGVTLVEFGFDAERHPKIDALVGGGKMFAVGDNRVLIAQRNGHHHIRGYAGLRIPEQAARDWMMTGPDRIRALLRDAFAGWASALTDIVESGDFIGVRPLHALPISHRWRSRAGITLLGDAAHLMSPFSGEGVNLALADAADLAEALAAPKGWERVAAYESIMMQRARPAAEGAAEGLNSSISSNGVAAVLDHYRERLAG
ncbi:monooxygenase FAD-binding [Methylocella silvestris BL2]|uniref:Monooxygenase FAD-binding n=1 Tax=Methylocella silvestris (strain DSM 15510 / CIP 108128 / LMG 27833 / NCIMB 13906 / BL2) TaxID=395965 RepID=B8ESL0_METSB|nr:FAD-dependent monooxygenase [Methylocella silvestris]ACK50345.1 monooxygenase FAD-binding [Methylocella silvestris BL2]